MFRAGRTSPGLVETELTVQTIYRLRSGAVRGLARNGVVTMKCNEGRRGERAREIETLGRLDFRRTEDRELLFRFHPFGEHHQPGRFQERRDRIDPFRGGTLRADLID